MDDSEVWFEQDDLIDMKWGDSFSCVKCGSDNYRVVLKGKGRRCKDCGREESLFKYTAFERVKIPFDRIQDLLLTIRDATERIIEGDIIQLRRNKSDVLTPKPQRTKSVMEYIYDNLEKEEKRFKIWEKRNEGKKDKAEFKEFDYDSIIESAIRKARPSLRQLSWMIGAEENSINLLLNKINQRMPFHEIENAETPYLRIELFFEYTRVDAYRRLMRLLMFPLVGKWEYGIYKDDPKITVFESRKEWKITDEEDYITYGSEEWKKLFVEDFKAK